MSQPSDNKSQQSKAVVPYLRRFNEEETRLIGMLLAQVAPKATAQEKALFLYTAQKKGLDPFDKQIYLVPRWDNNKNGWSHSVQVSIDGLRLMAQRSGKYAGQTPYQWCGPDGKWVDVWLDDTTMPVAARVGVLRHDFKEPLYSVARFNDYKQTKKGGELNHFWEKFGPHMIGKCCEALSIRRAFPEETSGFYIPEEMGNPELTYSVAEVEQDDTAPIATSEVIETSGTPVNVAANTPMPITEQQRASIRKLCEHLDKPEPEMDALNYASAKELIAVLSTEYRAMRATKANGTQASQAETTPSLDYSTIYSEGSRKGLWKRDTFYKAASDILGETVDGNNVRSLSQDKLQKIHEFVVSAEPVVATAK